MNALVMVGQRLDHAAFLDASMAAFLDHRFQFKLEGIETAYSLFDVTKAILGDVIGRGA